MVGTRHCCWGECKTDSRYPEKWPESIKELEKSGKKVFIPVEIIQVFTCAKDMQSFIYC